MIPSHTEPPSHSRRGFFVSNEGSTLTVVLYSRPNCQPCRLTKADLDRRGIPYDERDVTAEPEALDALIEAGFREAPVVIAGDRSWSGFRPDLIDSLAQA